MSQGFDIQQQAELAKEEDKGIDVHIHGVDEKPLYYMDGDVQKPVTINVSGVHSEKHRRVEAMLRKRKLKPNQFTGQFVYEDAIERAAACTNDWQGFFADGKVVPFSQANVREVYKRAPWVHDQIAEAMNDHSRFFGNASNSQQNTSIIGQD